jgi:uncharacterized protein YbjT (DUF2867 family)
MTADNRRVLVTGGGTFLGDNIAAALITEGAEVTLLVREQMMDNLGVLAQRARCIAADVWDPASLRGRARGHGVVIHTVGSMIADPAQGLTYHRLNFVSARNVATMCISDGVTTMILMSSVRAPWINRQYVRAKREAEHYLDRVGVNGVIVRAPIAYVRGQPRPFFFDLMTFFGSVPPFSWLGFNRVSPMPIDMLARGVARIALDSERHRSMYFAPQLRRINTRDEVRGNVSLSALRGMRKSDETDARRVHPFELLDDDTPFGWTPPEDR